MFEREKQIIINKASEAIFAHSDEVALKKVINLTLPEPVLKFFVEEVESKLNKELKEIKNFSTFNFDLPDAQPFFAHAFTLLKMNRLMKKNEFSTILLFALDFNFDFLLKPCENLTSFIYDYYENLGYDAIQDKLRYIIVYSYLTELIYKYLSKLKPNALTKKDFYNLVKTLLNEYTQGYSLSEHYNHFAYFKSFLKALRFDIEPIQEAGAFQIYLLDIGRNDLAEQIIKTKSSLVDGKLEFKDYLKSIDNHFFSKDVGIEPRIMPSQEETKPAKQELQSLLSDNHTNTDNFRTQNEFNEHYVQDIEETDLSNHNDFSFGASFREDLEKVNSLSSEKHTSKINDQQVISNTNIPFPSKIIENEIRDIFPQNQNEKQKPVEEIKKPVVPQPTKSFETKMPLRDLVSVIPERTRKKFIKKIFKNKEEEFNQTMRILNSAKNWDEASNHLIGIFQKNDVEPYSSIALKFTELLYQNIK